MEEKEFLTVKTLRKIIANLDDDFKIEIRVRTKLTEDELRGLTYPYPYYTRYTSLEFDDIGHSDKVLCLGCEISR